MLQRIYGTAFNKKEELAQHLKNLEEAKRRDHRRLGKELDLFSFQEDGGPGLAYWHPNGGLIRHIIETFWKEEHLKRGYDLVYTPHIARAHLWQISGHLDFYKENQTASRWVEGKPEKTFIGAVAFSDRQNYHISAFRCDHCGYLEFYAVDPKIVKDRE